MLQTHRKKKKQKQQNIKCIHPLFIQSLFTVSVGGAGKEKRSAALNNPLKAAFILKCPKAVKRTLTGIWNEPLSWQWFGISQDGMY